MPGIFGLAKKNLEYSDDIALRMYYSMKHENWYMGKWINDQVIMGKVILPHIKCDEINKSDGIKIVMQGFFFNKNELIKKLHYDNNYSMSDIIKEIYLKEKLKFYKYFNGLYNIAIYDDNAEMLIILNDHFGYYPLFFSEYKDNIIFASEAKGVLEGLNSNLSREIISESSIPQFLTFRFPLRNNSFYKKVKRLRPATIIYFNLKTGNFRKYKYYDFLNNKKRVKKVNQNSLVKDFGKLMNKSIERCVEDNKKIGLFLSGGLDSTMIAAFASSLDIDLICFTLGKKNSNVREISSRVAELFGHKNIFLEIDPKFIQNYAKKIVYQGDGLIRIRECHYISQLMKIKNIVDIILFGTFGEIFRDNIFPYLLSYYNSRFKGENMFNFFLKFQTGKLPLDEYSKVFTKHFSREARKSVIYDFHDEFNDIFRSNRIRICDIRASSGEDLRMNWGLNIGFQKGLSQSFQYLDWYLETRHPFLDYDLFYFGLGLPLYLKQNNLFLHKAMKHYFPKLSKIELEHGYSFDANFLGVPLGKLKTSIINGRRLTYLRNKNNLRNYDYRDYVSWINNSKQYVLEVLNDNSLINTYIKRSYIHDILENHFLSKTDNNQIICDLINLELLLKIYS